MRTHSAALALLLILTSCCETKPCKFSVGQRVRLLTGEVLMVIEATPSCAEPHYVLSEGVGWKLRWSPSGLSGTKGRYLVYEHVIAGEAQ